MSVPQALLIFAVAWLVVVGVGWLVVVPFLRHAPAEDAFSGLLWWILRLYTRFWHCAQFFGVEHLPRSGSEIPNGLIVVANHTGAVDPLLLQAPCRFLIHWMMAADMMGPELGWLWRHHPPIAVARDGRDMAPLRASLRLLRSGNAVGIFPEGRITTPPREVRPFLPGVGLLIARTHAPVLLAWISGTPDTNRMGEALASRSRSRVEFLGLIDYPRDADAETISADLRRRIAEASGWPLNDDVLPPGGVEAAGVEAAGVEAAGVEAAGVETAGVEPAGAEPAGVEPAEVDPAGLGQGDVEEPDGDNARRVDTIPT